MTQQRTTEAAAMQLFAVYTTVATQDQARAMARALVERKLSACAQISAIESVYVWNGELQQGPEVRVLFKTTASQLADLEAAILDMHAYELPAVHAVALQAVHEPYAAWVIEGCGG